MSGSLRQRLVRAAANPAFVLELGLEPLGRALSTAWFRLQCLWHGVSAGRNLDIFGRCIIRRGLDSRIELGNHVQIISSSWRSSTANCGRSKLRTYYPTARIIMGDRSGMTGGAIIARSKTIRIGAGCMLAPNVTIFDSDFHAVWPPDARRQELPLSADADVVLEPNVWVGMGVLILKGVTIGENSVIGAGSVVVSDIPANCVAAGNPARVVKTFS